MSPAMGKINGEDLAYLQLNFLKAALPIDGSNPIAPWTPNWLEPFVWGELPGREIRHKTGIYCLYSRIDPIPPYYIGKCQDGYGKRWGQYFGTENHRKRYGNPKGCHVSDAMSRNVAALHAEQREALALSFLIHPANGDLLKLEYDMNRAIQPLWKMREG